MIDTTRNKLILPTHQAEVDLKLSPKGLHLVHINQLVTAHPSARSVSPVAETFAQDSLDIVDERCKRPSIISAGQEASKTSVDTENQRGLHGENQACMNFHSGSNHHFKIHLNQSRTSFTCNSHNITAISLRTVPARSQQHPISPTMSDWVARLQRVQANMPREEAEEIPDVSLADLKVEKMTFGKTHMGRTYEEIWLGYPEWMTWFYQHYRMSTKAAHRRVILFIEKMVEETEAQQSSSAQTPVQPKTQATPKIMTLMPKSKTNTRPIGHGDASPVASERRPCQNSRLGSSSAQHGECLAADPEPSCSSSACPPSTGHSDEQSHGRGMGRSLESGGELKHSSDLDLLMAEVDTFCSSTAVKEISSGN